MSQVEHLLSLVKGAMHSDLKNRMDTPAPKATEEEVDGAVVSKPGQLRTLHNQDSSAAVATIEKVAASSTKKIQKAMTEAGLPRDVTFCVNGEQATAIYGDWHESEIWEVGNKLGRKLFKKWEDPDDSEMAPPDWTKTTVSSKTEGPDVIHDCRHNHCSECGDVLNYCRDMTDGKHEPKKVTNDPCYSCKREKERYSKERQKAASTGDLVDYNERLKRSIDAAIKDIPEAERAPYGAGHGIIIGACGHQIRRCMCANHQKEIRIGIRCRTCEKAGQVKSGAIPQSELRRYAKYRRESRGQKKEPSKAQVDASNYKMGHITCHGIDITIENEKGSTRRGVSAAGKKWESTLTCPYGYIRSAASGKSGERVRPRAIDGDHLDVFVGPKPTSELVVVIDQFFNGKYDESKFILGCSSKEEAVKLYRSNYQRGWPEMPVSTATVAQLKEWLKTGKHQKPFKGQMVKAAGWLG